MGNYKLIKSKTMKFYTLLALVAATSAIRIPDLPNMGKSNDVALTAGQAVAANVVATQQATEAASTSAHAAAMDAAAAATAAHMRHVRAPRNEIVGQQAGWS